MEKKAQAILNHFGEEKQREKAKEEYLELQIALMELSKFDLKNKSDFFIEAIAIERENFKYSCNEEFADNILMFMQINDLDFEEAFEEVEELYNKEKLSEFLFLENFNFDKEKVFEIVNQKIDRTIERFKIKI